MLNPTPSLLCKLASIAVHADELLSPDSHQFDKDALVTLLGDEEVKGWLAKMTAAAMAPMKRQTGEAR